MVRKTRPIWIWFHKWTALILGLWIVLNGLSGTLLVFQREIEANLDLDLYRTGQPYETADFAVMTEAVGAAYPGMSFHKVERDNKYADEAYRFTLSPDGEPQSYFTDLEVFVKPVTGEILGDRPWLTFMKATRLFHMELLAGHTGETVMGYMAIFLTISIFVGVVLWWPKNGKYKRALQVKSARSAQCRRHVFSDRARHGVYHGTDRRISASGTGRGGIVLANAADAAVFGERADRLAGVFGPCRRSGRGKLSGRGADVDRHAVV
jgi:uncharacterized iron-regulated membrane protein